MHSTRRLIAAGTAALLAATLLAACTSHDPCNDGSDTGADSRIVVPARPGGGFARPRPAPRPAPARPRVARRPANTTHHGHQHHGHGHHVHIDLDNDCDN